MQQDAAWMGAAGSMGRRGGRPVLEVACRQGHGTPSPPPPPGCILQRTSNKRLPTMSPAPTSNVVGSSLWSLLSNSWPESRQREAGVRAGKGCHAVVCCSSGSQAVPWPPQVSLPPAAAIPPTSRNAAKWAVDGMAPLMEWPQRLTPRQSQPASTARHACCSAAAQHAQRSPPRPHCNTAS